MWCLKHIISVTYICEIVQDTQFLGRRLPGAAVAGTLEKNWPTEVEERQVRLAARSA